MNVKSASTGGFRTAGCVHDGGDLHIMAMSDMATLAESLRKASYMYRSGISMVLSIDSTTGYIPIDLSIVSRR